MLFPTILFGQRNVDCPRKETGNLTGSSICYGQNKSLNSVEFSVLQQALCLKQFTFMYNIFTFLQVRWWNLKKRELTGYWN